MMQLVGLNGFNIWPVSMLIPGRIDSFFHTGFFPYRWNWRAKDAEILRDEIVMSEYILVGFSDGGTLAYRLASLDDRCKGLIVHSGMFPKIPLRKELPILLIATQGDLTPTAAATRKAYDWYTEQENDVTFVDVRSSTWMKHEFEPGLPFMELWCRIKFNYQLPVHHGRDKIYD